MDKSTLTINEYSGRDFISYSYDSGKSAREGEGLLRDLLSGLQELDISRITFNKSILPRDRLKLKQLIGKN